MPDSLEKWLNVVGEKTGCKLNAEIGFDCDDEGLHAFARTWANGCTVSAAKPSAHELMEAGVKLKEIMKAQTSQS